MYSAGDRKSGRVLLISIGIVLLLALIYVIWARQRQEPAPVNAPMRQQTRLYPLVPG